MVLTYMVFFLYFRCWGIWPPFGLILGEKRSSVSRMFTHRTGRSCNVVGTYLLDLCTTPGVNWAECWRGWPLKFCSGYGTGWAFEKRASRNVCLLFLLVWYHDHSCVCHMDAVVEMVVCGDICTCPPVLCSGVALYLGVATVVSRPRACSRGHESVEGFCKTERQARTRWG